MRAWMTAMTAMAAVGSAAAGVSGCLQAPVDLGDPHARGGEDSAASGTAAGGADSGGTGSGSRLEAGEGDAADAAGPSAACARAVPSVLEFGITPVGETHTMVVVVTNCGDMAVDLNAAEIEEAGFYVHGMLPGPLAPGQAKEVTVAFAPLTPARVSSTLRFFGDRSDGGRTELAVVELHGGENRGHHVGVELTWHTPGAPEGAFPAGGDLDLHFVHPAASSECQSDLCAGIGGPWFDPLYDCFWQNPRPVWDDMLDPEQSPTLDADSTDGTGPETLRFVPPPLDRTYRIGVHYFDDAGYGPATPTLVVSLDGETVFSLSPGPLEPGCLWEAAEVTQGSAEGPVIGKVYGVDGRPAIRCAPTR
ncbi:MAG: hypothetical protein U1F43_25365 [Myxococcota bacterium]